MDIDRYLATHKPAWDRLAQLSAKGRRGARKLNAQQVEELTELYEHASSNLSHIRTQYRDPALVAYLTRVVSSAGAVVYGTRPKTWRTVGRFFSITFPAAVWRARRFIVVATLLFMIPALVSAIWIANSPDVRDALMPEAVREAYINHDFEEYYASEEASQFSSSVFTNNAQVGFIAFAFGIAFCIPTVAIMVINGVNLGFAAGLFAAYGQQEKFWGLIAPHGLLEITAIFVAGGAGLQLGWALIDPGDRTRSEAIADVGKRAVVIVLGLVCAFFIAGLIEGFVTGQPWPTGLRVGIGVVAWLGFIAYVVVLGRAAERNGFTGKLGEDEQTGWVQLR